MNRFSLQERRNPEWYAQDLRQDMEIPDSAPIDLDNIIRALDIHLKIARIGKGILGACKVKGLQKLIVISPDISYESQKRFTISHEIGHLIIHHGVHYCNANDLKIWINVPTKEKEANKFAAESAANSPIKNNLYNRFIKLDKKVNILCYVFFTDDQYKRLIDALNKLKLTNKNSIVLADATNYRNIISIK